jgi:Flp pilus assembly protein TadD
MMKKARFLFLLLAPLLLTSCLTIRPRSQRPSSEAVVVQNVPVRVWGDNTCGSAALSSVLNHFGDPVTEDQLNATLDKGLHGGVVTVDLLLEARRRGFDAKLVPGSEALLAQSIQNGTPVILLLRVIDLPGRRGDFFHYVVADGYDASTSLFRTQFGDGKSRWIHLRSIERNWRAGGRATLLVSGKSATASTTAETLRRAVDLEERGERAAAIAIYRDLLQRENSALVWTNLANALAAEGSTAEAASAYEKAIALEESRDALNNYAWLLYQQKKYDEAKSIALRAVAAKGPDAWAAQETLAEILAARNECAASVEAYRAAFDAVPTQEPGRKASMLLGMARAQRACGNAEQARQTLNLALQLQPDAATAQAIQKELAQ